MLSSRRLWPPGLVVWSTTVLPCAHVLVTFSTLFSYAEVVLCLPGRSCQLWILNISGYCSVLSSTTTYFMRTTKQPFSYVGVHVIASVCIPKRASWVPRPASSLVSLPVSLLWAAVLCRGESWRFDLGLPSPQPPHTDRGHCQYSF